MHARSSGATGGTNAGLMPTEMAFAIDGRIYVIADEDAVPSGGSVFFGYALTPDERNGMGPRGLLLTGLMGIVFAIGTDGEIYLDARDAGPEALLGRMTFRGFALTEEEAEIAWGEIHRMAFNVPAGIRLAKGRRQVTRLRAVER